MHGEEVAAGLAYNGQQELVNGKKSGLHAEHAEATVGAGLDREDVRVPEKFVSVFDGRVSFLSLVRI